MARHESEATQMLQSRQLVKARDYTVRVIAGTRGVWIILLAIVDTGASPKIIRKEFAMAA